MNDKKEHLMVAVPDAIRTVLQETARLCLSTTTRTPTDTVKLSNVTYQDLLGRTVAVDVTMREPGHPPYQASIMDGFAVRTTECKNDLSTTSEWTHSLVDKIFAGSENQPKKSNNNDSSLPLAYYVTTGAVVPSDFDCVVPVEQCRVGAASSQIGMDVTATLQPGKWIRDTGCDIPGGSVVLPAGHVLDAAAVGLLYQTGQEQVELCRPLRVGVLSTGTELISPGGGDWDQMRIGTIPDVNRPVLLSLLSTFGTCLPIDLGMARDDNIDAMTATIEAALQDCNVIITTGGISMGETDVVERVLVERLQGQLHFGRMHMKPGKPTTFVTIPSQQKGTRLVFAMPGNPVSATVCTQLLVRPCLDLLFNGPDRSADTDGDSVEEQIRRIVRNAFVHPEVQVKLAHRFQLDTERPEYHRVVLNMATNGSYEASSTGVQRSSRLMSMRDAEGLLVLPQASSSKAMALTGETHTVLLLRNQAQKIQLGDSLHLNKKPSKSYKVSIVQVLSPKGNDASAADISDRVESAMSGSKSGSVRTVSARVYSGPAKNFLGFVKAKDDDADILVVSCSKFDGSFRYYAELSHILRSSLTKVADSMALQARRGAASQDPASALFEVVIGFVPEGRGTNVIMLPEEGLDGGLGNVRGLLKHALTIARGPIG